MQQSYKLFNEAQQYIPGGVNSPVRAFKSVGGNPVFFKKAEGAYIWDEDGNLYIDYVGSWGPMILGHAHPAVVKSVQATMTNGLSFGAPTQLEIELAKTICELMPAIEKVRLVNSGTEATMSAIRLARGFTGRDKIVKFEGCYHGHVDSLLIKAGSGALALGVPTSAGLPKSYTEHTLVATYNDLASVETLFQQWGNQIAAIIVEPVAGNMNCIPPVPGFLQGLRDICNQYQSLLIFDEVMTGFRISLGGAQEYFQVTPDLTTLGKIIGGGMPVGAFGGRKEIMDHIAPLGAVYQAGTLSGNPIATTAGLATLKQIAKPEFYEYLNENTENLLQGIQTIAKAKKIPLYIQHVGSMFGLFFTDAQAVNQFEQVMQCDIERFKRFFHAMLAEGIYFAPSAFEAGFVSSVHTKPIIETTLTAVEKVFTLLSNE